MAINRARLSGVMVARDIAPEAPAMEFADVLDQEIEAAHQGLATEESLALTEARLMQRMAESDAKAAENDAKAAARDAEAAARLNRAVTLILLGISAATAVIGVLVVLT